MENNVDVKREISIEEDKFNITTRNAVLLVAKNYSKSGKKVIVIDYCIPPTAFLLALLYGLKKPLDNIEQRKIYQTKWSYDVMLRPKTKLYNELKMEYDIIIKVKP